jgi:hypothetical protein
VAKCRRRNYLLKVTQDASLLGFLGTSKMTKMSHLGRGRAKLRPGGRTEITCSTPCNFGGVAGEESDVGSFGEPSVSSSLGDVCHSN